MMKLLMEYLHGRVLIVVKQMILNVIIMFIVKVIIKIGLACNKWYVRYKEMFVHHKHKMFL